jgi:phytol kinase
MNDLAGMGILMAYYLVACALVPTLFKIWFKVPTELVRKTQHVAYAMSIFLMLKLFSAWYIAIGAAFGLVLLGYPLLTLFEKSPFYMRILVARSSRGGELRRQLLYVQLSFALLIFIFWGLLGVEWQFIIAGAVMAWGFGDAAAALIGKAFGKHRFIHNLIEGAKTHEGTLAMICFAGAALFLTLVFYAGLPWAVSLLAAVLVAPVSGLVELFSKRGLDTLTVPFTTAALLIALVSIFTQIGWVTA